MLLFLCCCCWRCKQQTRTALIGQFLMRGVKSLGRLKTTLLPGGHVTGENLLDASSFSHVFLWLGSYLSDHFSCNCSYFIVSGICMVGCFPTLWCNQHFRKKENVSDKSCPQYPADLHCLKGIHTFSTASGCYCTERQLWKPWKWNCAKEGPKSSSPLG